MTTGYALRPKQKRQCMMDAIHEARIDAPSKERFQALAAAHGLSMRAALTQLVEQQAEMREPFQELSKRSKKRRLGEPRHFTEMLPEVQVRDDVGLALRIDANRAGIRLAEAMRQLVWRCIQESH